MLDKNHEDDSTFPGVGNAVIARQGNFLSGGDQSELLLHIFMVSKQQLHL